MKQSAFFICFFMSGMLALNSCNNEGITETNKDSTAVNNAIENPNTIVTTPENMMVVIHNVKDFASWKTSYDAHDSVRLANDIHSYVIGRGAEDSNSVMVAVKPRDIEKAKAFSKNPTLKEAMQKGGVTGAPKIDLVTMVWQDTAKLSTPLRSRVSFTVKDFEAWKNYFQTHRQERMDNGVVDRIVGHDADDNKKVFIVTAITDTAKAAAYWNSDILKQRRSESGVTSQPDRFAFRIVHRY